MMRGGKDDGERVADERVEVGGKGEEGEDEERVDGEEEEEEDEKADRMARYVGIRDNVCSSSLSPSCSPFWARVGMLSSTLSEEVDDGSREDCLGSADASV